MKHEFRIVLDRFNINTEFDQSSAQQYISNNLNVVIKSTDYDMSQLIRQFWSAFDNIYNTHFQYFRFVNREDTGQKSIYYGFINGMFSCYNIHEVTMHQAIILTLPKSYILHNEL